MMSGGTACKAAVRAATSSVKHESMLAAPIISTSRKLAAAKFRHSPEHRLNTNDCVYRASRRLEASEAPTLSSRKTKNATARVVREYRVEPKCKALLMAPMRQALARPLKIPKPATRRKLRLLPEIRNESSAIKS